MPVSHGQRAHRRPWQRLGAGLLRRAPRARTDGALLASRYIYILPTRTGVGFAGMLLATLIGALNYQNNLALFFSFLMAAVALVSMHHCWFNLLGLRISAADAAPVFCGQAARFPVRLVETRGQARGEVCVRGAAGVVLAAHGQAQVLLHQPTTRRGDLALDLVIVETRHPLGLFRAWSRAEVRATVLVYPRPAAHAPAPPQRAAFAASARGDQGRGADDFVGLRAYHAGDSPRQLDWKALARERGLVVKQFGGDHATRVWLDWEQTSGTLEARLGQLTRQVLQAHEQQLTFGLRLPGQQIERNRGEGHKHRCLAALARFEPRFEPHFDQRGDADPAA